MFAAGVGAQFCIGLSRKSVALNRTVEPLQNNAHRAAQVVPVHGRADDERPRRADFVEHRRELVVREVLPVDLPIPLKLPAIYAILSLRARILHEFYTTAP